MRPGHWVPLILLLGLLAGGWVAGLFRGEAPASVIEGQVVDRAGPVCAARVRFRGEAPMVMTDAHGRFRLRRSRTPSGTVAVAREGFLVQTFPADRFPATARLPGLPEDREDYSWIEPGPEPAGDLNCVNCHGEIYREWDGSAHARAATNRHFLNLYDGSDWHGRRGVGWNLRADNPDGAGVCSACHAPTVTVNDAAFDDLRRARGVNRRGVHCDFCHKIAAATVDKRGLTFGRFGYRLLRPAERQFFFGPLDDAERPGEAFSFSPLYQQSRYCASCHEGVVFGVPVYTTYSEWLASPAGKEGKQCQACHMSPTGTLSNIAPGRGGIERDPATLAGHSFPGGRADMLRKCLAVAVRVNARGEGTQVHVEVEARNVGHRVPTGFIDRNLLLVVEAQDASGKPLPRQAGPTLPGLAGKGFAGKPGRLYAKQLPDEARQHPIPFWRVHGDLFDTRLQPGRADRADFVFPKGTVQIRVRLVYRRFWKEVADAKRWPDNEVIVLDRYFPVR